MPHNLVIVKPGTTKKVGDASFKMLNDPKAGEKDYVPDLPDVLHFVPVIDPNKQHSLHFSTLNSREIILSSAPSWPLDGNAGNKSGIVFFFAQRPSVKTGWVQA